MRYSDIDQFFDGIAWNRSFYGALCKNGHWIWASDIQDILSYPDRVKYFPITEQPFGKVREALLLAAPINHMIGKDE